jgi:hypothetical protein
MNKLMFQNDVYVKIVSIKYYKKVNLESVILKTTFLRNESIVSSTFYPSGVNHDENVSMR